MVIFTPKFKIEADKKRRKFSINVSFCLTPVQIIGYENNWEGL